MQPISRLRILIILGITLVSLWLILPTIRYYVDLRNAPSPSSPPPQVDTPPPPEDNITEFSQWLAQHPDFAAWRDQNTEYLNWQTHNDELRLRAIPLGLDLLGGVDVTLSVDVDKAVQTKVASLMDSLKRALRDQQIAAEFTEIDNGKAFTIKLEDPETARSAANLLAQYATLAEPPTAEDLREAYTVRINEQELEASIQSDVQGAKRAVEERINSLGVTQPRISIQGENQIRLMVPGERNPETLIRNVIRPAELEFRLVHQSQEQFLGPDGKVRPEAELPVGYERVPGLLADRDPDTGKINYSPMDFVVFDKPELTGKDLRSASVIYDTTDFRNPIQVSLEFNSEGAQRFAEVTGENIGRQLAILLDGTVRSAPVLETAINEGRAVIRGGFSQEEAQDLSQILKAGSLPAPLKIESKRAVGASLGGESIRAGVRALTVGAAAVGVFMIVYYGTAGFIAVLALILNILIILAIMALAKATLTLSGIGGILLTVGMAVDANVLIYERIREEVRGGRPLRQAIGLGFNRAFSVILDSNLTTLVTALVLLQFTEGSVFGFALTMTFGLLANLFTGLTVTYTLCVLWFNWRGSLSLGKLAIFQNPTFDWIKMRFFSWSLSVMVLVIGLILVLLRGGLDMGVDFAGGYRSEIQFTGDVSEDQIRRSLLDHGLVDPNVIPVLYQDDRFIVDVKLADPTNEAQAQNLSSSEYTENLFRQSLADTFGDGYEIQSSTTFGPQTSQGFKTMAIVVVLLAAFSILIYLWMRFELAFGVAAVIALIHDLVIVTVWASVFDVQISLDAIAALMVLMGFSVNDTIVIFDRIRENTRTLHGKTFREICNLSMNQSLSRTLITSGTVLVTVLALFFLGGEGLRSFATIYLLGTFVGVYSTDFLAAPMIYQWNQYKGNRLQQTLAARKKKREAAKPIRSAGAATRPVGER